MFSILNNIKISGISCAVPKNELLISDNKNLYNGNLKKIERLINSSGFYKRRVVDANTTTSDLCEIAANNVIKNLNIKPSSIDGIIFSSYTPDFLMPATSYVLHKKLQLNDNCITMDVPQACSGFVMGLFQSAMLINSGCKRVLLLVGDTFSKFSDMFNDTEPNIFGDAGSAALIEYNSSPEPFCFNIYTYSNDFESLICSNGAFRNPVKINDFNNSQYMYNSKMNGKKIFDFAMQRISPCVDELLFKSQVNKDDIQYWIFHQANKFIVQNIAQQLNIDLSRVPIDTLSKYGNQCGASIPCVICDKLSDVIGNSKSKLLLCGFGAGLSVASVIINTENVYCSKVIEI